MQSLGIQRKENLEGGPKSCTEKQVCIRRYAEQQAHCIAQLNEWATGLQRNDEDSSSLCGTCKIESQEQHYSYAKPLHKIVSISSNDEQVKCMQSDDTTGIEQESTTEESEPLEEEDSADLLKYQKQGNTFYNEGNFQKAVNCYTKCLVLNPQSDVAYSNRAMSFLKLKEWRNAEDDATASLRINPWNTKSLLRRSAARASMGKLRAALQDCYLAEISFRCNKTYEVTVVTNEIVTARQNIQKLLREALYRAPTRYVSIPAMKT